MTSFIDERFKGGFEPNQLVSSTDVVRSFSKIRLRAKQAPLLILDKNCPDSVLLSIDDYNKVMEIIDGLSEEIFDLKVIDRIREMEREGYEKVKFKELASAKVLTALQEIKDWEISDEELFE